METKEGKTNIESLFELFSGAAMAPRPYVEKKPIPASVNVLLGEEDMRLLQVISARIGAKRGNVAHHILKLGLHEAAYGCGFTVDENGNIPPDQLKWDTTLRRMGVSFPGDEKEAA